MKKIIVFLTLIISITAGIWFLQRNENKETSGSKPKVAATIFPLYDITANIAGDTVETVLLLPPGASPHAYEPSPESIKKVENSDVIFMIGHGIDSWSNSIAQSANITNSLIVDQNVELLEYSGADHSHDEETGEAVEEEPTENGIDPHYWLSIINAKGISLQIRDELIRMYPDHAEAFKANYEAYAQELSALDEENKEKIQSLDNKQIATFHNAFGYLAHEYGIEVVTTFEEFPGEEPSPEYVQEFSEHIEEDGITVIFAEPQFSASALEPIADDLGVTISQLDPVGGVADRDSFISLMRYNVNQINSALQ